MIGTYLGKGVRLTDQWLLYEALRSTASIIFAVASVWLALIYPDRLKSPYTKTSIDPVYKEGFKQLFTPIINSIYVLCAVLLVGILVPIIKELNLSDAFIPWLRAASMLLLTSLTMFQVYTVLSLFIPIANIMNKHEQDAHVTNLIDDLTNHPKE
ncbi:MAG: hypothetical protein J6574_08585 [Gilliamella sp.]|nr:hypothetical protein [Snodgrassella communis]MCO6561143.1 hypothetical protein [Gilliamella sp.]